MSSANRIANLPHEFVPAYAEHGVIDITDTVLDVSDTTLTLHEQTGYLQVQIETAAVRLTVGGTAPTSSVGFRYDAGVEFYLSRSEWLASKWVREGGTSAVLQVAQYLTK